MRCTDGALLLLVDGLISWFLYLSSGCFTNGSWRVLNSLLKPSNCRPASWSWLASKRGHVCSENALFDIRKPSCESLKCVEKMGLNAWGSYRSSLNERYIFFSSSSSSSHFWSPRRLSPSNPLLCILFSFHPYLSSVVLLRASCVEGPSFHWYLLSLPSSSPNHLSLFLSPKQAWSAHSWLRPSPSLPRRSTRMSATH